MTPNMESAVWLALLAVPAVLYLLSWKIGVTGYYVCFTIALWLTFRLWRVLGGISAEIGSIYLPWAVAVTVFLYGLKLLIRRRGTFRILSGLSLLCISFLLVKDLKLKDLKELRGRLFDPRTGPLPTEEDSRGGERRGATIEESLDSLNR